MPLMGQMADCPPGDLLPGFTLGQLPVGGRLVLKCKKDWRDAKRRDKGQTDSSTAPQNRPTDGHGHLNPSLEDITFSSFAESEGEEPALAPSSGNEPPRDSGAYQPEMD